MLLVRTHDQAAGIQVEFAACLPGAVPRHIAGTAVAIGPWLVDVPPAGEVTILAMDTGGSAVRLAGHGCDDAGMPLRGVLADAVRLLVAAAPRLGAVA